MSECNCFLVFLATVNGLLMSLAVGVDSSSKNMGLDDKDKSNESEVSGETMPKTPPNEENVDEQSGGMSRQMSENSISVTEDEEDDEDRKIELGPQYTLKEQFEKDKVCFFYLLRCVFCLLSFCSIHLKSFFFLFVVVLRIQDDESLRRWKEQLLGSVDFESVGGKSCEFCRFSCHVLWLDSEVLRTVQQF